MRDSLADAPGGTLRASFHLAKISAGRWAQSGIDDPSTQNAPPWYVGRPFTASRTENPRVYKDWDDAFRNRTYTGFEFGAPPPEPQKDSSAVTDAKPMSNKEKG
jgi:hypothetical protein